MLFSRRISHLTRTLKFYPQLPRFFLHTPKVPLRFYFSNPNPAAQKMHFKAETKKLLDIVAKSLYTDSEVFLRELLSNASDALEKQRLESQSNEGLHVNIEIIPGKRQIVIEDNGVGMSK